MVRLRFTPRRAGSSGFDTRLVWALTFTGRRHSRRVRSRAVSTLVEVSAPPLDRHRAAVRNSFGWAQESADRGDYADALLWIYMLEVIGEQLPPDVQAKRRAWRGQLAANDSRWEAC